MLTITPVLEVPWKAEGYEWPWPVLPDPPYSLVPLDAAHLECMGTFFAALCAGDSPDSIDSCLSLIRDADGLIACGGFLISDGAVHIRPSCCSGLENCHEWRAFLKGGISPWFGHNPFGWAERTEHEVIIWTDGADVMPHRKGGPFIAARYSVFDSALVQAEARLKAFISALPQWLTSVGGVDGSDILQKIERDFRLNV